jgi:ADP-dependent NAD(P)H-hydrate dehydratase
MSNPNPPRTLPSRTIDAHKGHFGRVAMIGGSRGMAGSISLSARAALQTGSGLVTAIVPDRCLETVAAFHPCVMTVPFADDEDGRFSDEAVSQLPGQLTKFDVIGCGPGMTTSIGSQRIVDRLLHACHVGTVGPSSRDNRLGVVLDADAINILAILDWTKHPKRVTAPLVLTPHPGELQRLCGGSPNNRPAQIDAAQRIAESSGAVIVVKGGPTVVVDKDRRWVNETGNPGMATAGCGDVLTGIIASLLGQALDAWDAASLGVWIHGRAGDRTAQRLGMYGMTALDLLDDLPHAVRDAEAD